jgi:hypothetical protein
VLTLCGLSYRKVGNKIKWCLEIRITILRTVWFGFLDGSIAGDGKRIMDNLTKDGDGADKRPLISVK